MIELNLNSVTLEKNGTPVELMGVTDKEKEWELIATVTTTEPVTAINITQDLNGLPFALSECYLTIKFGLRKDATGTSSARVYTNTEDGFNGYCTLTACVRSDYPGYGVYSSEVRANRLRRIGRGGAYNDTISSFSETVISTDITDIHSLKVQTQTAATIPVPEGTLINLYGVRA